MADEPASSVIAAATRPPVHDSAVATVSFFCWQIVSSASAAALMWSSNISRPRQAHRRGCVGDDAFAAAGEAEPLARRCLHGHASRINPGNPRDVPADRVAVRTDLRRFANDIEIK